MASGAHTLLTTEQDWVKISSLATARDGLPLLRLVLELRVRDDGDQRLLGLIYPRLNVASSAQVATQGPTPAALAAPAAARAP
jgi:hypothetical protein